MKYFSTEHIQFQKKFTRVPECKQLPESSLGYILEAILSRNKNIQKGNQPLQSWSFSSFLIKALVTRHANLMKTESNKIAAKDFHGCSISCEQWTHQLWALHINIMYHSLLGSPWCDYLGIFNAGWTNVQGKQLLVVYGMKVPWLTDGNYSGCLCMNIWMMVLHLLTALHLFIYKLITYPLFQNHIPPFFLFVRVTHMKWGHHHGNDNQPNAFFTYI